MRQDFIKAIHAKNFWTVILLFLVTLGNQWFGLHIPTSIVGALAIVVVGLIGSRVYLASHPVKADIQKAVHSTNFWMTILLFLVGMGNQFLGLHLPSSAIVDVAGVVFAVITGHSYLAVHHATSSSVPSVASSVGPANPPNTEG